MSGQTDGTFIEEHLEKLYSYARNHTYTADEADELTQDICVELLRSMRTMRSDSAEAWMWGVVRNTTRAFRRRAGRHRANVVYFDDTILPDFADEDAARDEILEKLRRKLLAISAEYREILVMHYFDGLPVEAIAEKTGIPSGTVKWRLSQGREKIRKDWDFEMEDTVIHPVDFIISFEGSGEYGGNTPFPNELISDALSKNILWHCREKGKTVEELSVLTGVPAYYIEDSLKNLVYREAVLKQSNRYVTDFMFIDAETCNRKAAELAEGIYRRLIECLCTLEGDIWENTTFSSETMFPRKRLLPQREFPLRYDGGHWIYMGWKDRKLLKEIGHNATYNLGEDCRWNYIKEGTYYYVKKTFGSIVSGGSGPRPLLRSYEINVCHKILGGYGSELGFDEKEREIIADLTERGYLRRTGKGDSDFEVTIPHYDIKRAGEQEKKTKKAVAPISEEVTALADELGEFCMKRIPERFRPYATRFHSGNTLLTACLELALRDGLLEPPSEPCCEFLIQHG